MFNLLSTPKQIEAELKGYSKKELDSVCKNMALIINALNVGVNQLLENRSIQGSFIPEMSKDDSRSNIDILEKLTLAQLLKSKTNLIKVINTLCLTEAVIVRDNFINCIESINDADMKTQPLTPLIQPEVVSLSSKELLSTPLFSNKSKVTTEEGSVKTSSEKAIEKSNVSPIRLTEVKQRLAQAVSDSVEKQVQVKNKLNSLLAPLKTNETKVTIKQA